MMIFFNFGRVRNSLDNLRGGCENCFSHFPAELQKCFLFSGNMGGGRIFFPNSPGEYQFFIQNLGGYKINTHQGSRFDVDGPNTYR